MTDKALEEILFRAAHGVLQSLATYPVEQRAALLPNVVRVMLAAFLEEVAGPSARNDESALQDQEEIAPMEKITFQDDCTPGEGTFVRVFLNGISYGRIVGRTGAYRFYKGESQKPDGPERADLELLKAIIVLQHRIMDEPNP